MEGLCAGGRPGAAAGQGGAPAGEAGGTEGGQDGASEGGRVGASEGGRVSEAGGKDAALEHRSRSSSPCLGHGAQEGLAPSWVMEGMDPNSSYLLKIRLFGNPKKARKEIRCFCFDKVIDSDLTNYKDLVESIIEQYPPRYLEVAHVQYYDNVLKILPEVKSDQDLLSMFEKHTKTKVVQMFIAYGDPSEPYEPITEYCSDVHIQADNNTHETDDSYLCNPIPENEHVGIDGEKMYFEKEHIPLKVVLFSGKEKDKSYVPEDESEDRSADESEDEHEVEEEEELHEPDHAPHVEYDKEERRKVAKKLDGLILPHIMKKLNTMTRDLNLEVVECSEEVAEVTALGGSGFRFVVNLQDRTCSCRQWQVSGLPCKHALAFITSLSDAHIKSYVDLYYSIEKFRAAYAALIPAMPDKSQWPESDHGFYMHPPLLKAKASRPKTERYKGCSDKKRTKGKHLCPICKEYGHHWPKCKKGNPDDIAAMMAIREPPKKRAKTSKIAQSSIVPCEDEAPTRMCFPPSQSLETTTKKKRKHVNSKSVKSQRSKTSSKQLSSERTMAADDNYWPPSPSPSPYDEKEILQLVEITALIVVGVLTMFLLHVLGYLRRRSSHKLLHAVVLVAYTLSYSLVSYILGLMQDSKLYFDEFPVWAVCMLMLLGGTDNLMACSLNDVDNWKGFHLKHLFMGGLVVYIFIVFGRDVQEIQKPLWAMLLVNVLQSCVRIKSMKRASKSNLLSKNVKPIADYMKVEDRRQLSSASTMKGYRYVVAGEHRMRNCGGEQSLEDVKITTVEEIWECDGILLSSERGMRLKDICLSMALAKMLNRRFAGFKLAEANLPKTNDFVFQGLLAGNNKYERAFRVIEVELGFVYDLFYTRYPFLYQKVRLFAPCLPVAMVTLCSWLTYLLFKRRKKGDNNLDIPLTTTLFLMLVVTFLEAFQLYLHLASDWFKVALIRSYVTRPALHNSGCFSEMIIGLALRFKTLRPWQNKLGQYSLLQNFDGTRRISKCVHYMTLWLVDKAKKGRKRGKPVKLSAQVKKSIIDSLDTSKGHLTNGASSLQSNGVYGMLSWACAREDSDEMVAHSILVWHVATTICLHKLHAALAKGCNQQAELNVEERGAIDTASSLSHYCAYLIAFAPDLLPGHSFESASKLDKSIQEARKVPSLRVAKTMENKCEILLRIGDTNSTNVVLAGAGLARKLMGDIEVRAHRWKVLSDFWAEMMLYVAPCDDAKARAHLEALATGGEFITHLWALLTHAGVLERGHLGPLPAV